MIDESHAPAVAGQSQGIETIELNLFLEALFQRHGYDFRSYAKASLKRRVRALAESAQCRHMAELIVPTLHDTGFLAKILQHLSLPVTEMFRDSCVFKSLREQVVPHLTSYSRLQIWQAGCASGEEVYSLAILLEEEGLLDRVQIYATDINDMALHQAEEGIFSATRLDEYERNYVKAGGTRALSDYYVATAGFFRIHERFRKRIVFAHHNLVTDHVFCETQLILCRNVLIYFESSLQSRALRLFHDSLCRHGFLCLGTKESLRSVESANMFSEFDRPNMIFRSQ